ncbi:hypothetical protein F9U64_07805 [Gracilibacillus oryzae]|uniref:DUF4901 domain-containing protein n=1 Tax=Gracilibacillus oryzae TaxID=1672701 RepID=A0A7C8KT84_9BACI|nr:hypothetical protein [Gracilibacillus oryzae]KAB8137830.1 hypothetical protein F9U64_07805 [Gracilibacillus oryzae]
MLDQRLQKLADSIKEKLGLDHYFLKRSSIRRKIDTYRRTKYIYCMEWFPLHIPEDPEGEDFNPEGTASIEVDIHSEKMESIIFVGKTSFANFKLEPSTESVVNWVESETGINRDQYRLVKETENNWQFKASVDNIPVFPSAQIDVNLNQDGQLLLFSVFGEFPPMESIIKEEFILSQENIHDKAYNQLKLIEFPDFKNARIQQVYGMEEIFVVNNDQSTISYDIGVPQGLRTQIEQILTWETSLDGEINRQPVFEDRQVSAEIAFANEPSPDAKPITEEEKNKCVTSVESLMRIEYADESGKWVLDHLYRDMEMIHAIVKPVKKNSNIFNKKIVVMIDRLTFEVLNYMDTRRFLDMICKFERDGDRNMEKTAAFEKLRSFFELKPYYVYDYHKEKYILCGKLDCDYYVDAVTGETGLLDDLHKEKRT